MLAAKRGDVIAVWTGTNLSEAAIRLGDLIEGKPAVANHVIGITHQDKLGRWIGIAGQPGGVSLQDCTPFLADPRTRSNHFMNRTDEDNDWLCANAAKALNLPYDWVGGIGQDVAEALHMDALKEELNRLYAWPTSDNLLPGHVVCSSLWARLYQMRNLPHPDAGQERSCTPGDWWLFNNAFPAVGE
jgi:hypothetical protein